MLPNKATRRVKKARVLMVSLVPRGKNELNSRLVLADGDPDHATLELVFASRGEEHGSGELEVYALAILPDVATPLMGRDKPSVIAGAEAVKEMVDTFGQGGFKIDLQHNFVQVPASKAYLTQSLVVQAGDARFSGILNNASGQPVDSTGGWGLVIRVPDPDLAAKYRSGEWDGVSMYGFLHLEEPVLASKDMTPEEIKELIAQAFAARAAALPAPPVPIVAEAPPLDPNSPKALRERARHARREAIVARLDADPENPETLEEVAAELEALDAPAPRKPAASSAGEGPARVGAIAQGRLPVPAIVVFPGDLVLASDSFGPDQDAQLDRAGLAYGQLMLKELREDRAERKLNLR